VRIAGTIIPPEARFCASCGATLGDTLDQTGNRRLRLTRALRLTVFAQMLRTVRSNSCNKRPLCSVGNKEAERPYPASTIILIPVISAVTLSNSKHLSPTYGAHTLSRWPAVLQSYGLGILHFPFGSALETVCLHQSTSLSFFSMNDKRFLAAMSIVNHGLQTNILLSVLLGLYKCLFCDQRN